MSQPYKLLRLNSSELLPSPAHLGASIGTSTASSITAPSPSTTVPYVTLWLSGVHPNLKRPPGQNTRAAIEAAAAPLMRMMATEPCVVTPDRIGWGVGGRGVFGGEGSRRGVIYVKRSELALLLAELLQPVVQGTDEEGEWCERAHL